VKLWLADDATGCQLAVNRSTLSALAGKRHVPLLPPHALTLAACCSTPPPQLVGKRPDGSTYEFQLNQTFNANQIGWFKVRLKNAPGVCWCERKIPENVSERMGTPQHLAPRLNAFFFLPFILISFLTTLFPCFSSTCRRAPPSTPWAPPASELGRPPSLHPRLPASQRRWPAGCRPWDAGQRSMTAWSVRLVPSSRAIASRLSGPTATGAAGGSWQPDLKPPNPHPP